MKHEILYERGDLFDVNMVITIMVSISGMPSEHELKEAFQSAVRVNEILCSKIVIEEGERAFYGHNSR